MLKEGWQESIRYKNKTGNSIGAEKELKKTKLGYYNQLTFEDKFFVDYCLAFHYVQRNDFYMANKCLTELLLLFHKNKRNMIYYKLEMNKYNWLFVNANHLKMDKEDIEEMMLSVYDYFLEIKDYVQCVAALANIFEKTGDKELLFECFKNILASENIDAEIVNNFLKCFKKYDEELYIKGLNLFNETSLKTIAN